MSVKQIKLNIGNGTDIFYELFYSIESKETKIYSIVTDEENVKIIVKNIDSVVEVAKDLGIKYEIEDVIIVELPNQSGAVNSILRRLQDEGISVQYLAPVFAGKMSNVIVIKTNEMLKTEKILTDSWDSLLEINDLV